MPEEGSPGEVSALFSSKEVKLSTSCSYPSSSVDGPGWGFDKGLAAARNNRAVGRYVDPVRLDVEAESAELAFERSVFELGPVSLVVDE